MAGPFSALPFNTGGTPTAPPPVATGGPAPTAPVVAPTASTPTSTIDPTQVQPNIDYNNTASADANTIRTGLPTLSNYFAMMQMQNNAMRNQQLSGGGLSNYFAMAQMQNNDAANAEAIRKQIEAQQNWTPQERMAALNEALAMKQQMGQQGQGAGTLSNLFAQLQLQDLMYKAISGATQPRAGDNADQAQARKDYRNGFSRAAQERSNAMELVAKFGGAGNFQNGDDKVNIQAQDGGNGQRNWTVTTTHKDGTNTTVQVQGDSTTVQDSNGSLLTQNGFNVSQTTNGKTTNFTLNNDGQAVVSSFEGGTQTLP